MGIESYASVEQEISKEKEQRLEKERAVFCCRVDSFIDRMHLILGDRRFLPWKGSVLDSVVGVFLTRNVSDHLSSSAFMSLAARFPLRSTPKQDEEFPNSQESSTPKQDEELPNSQESSTPKQDEELPNSQESSGSNEGAVLLDISGIAENRETMVEAEFYEQLSYNQMQKELECSFCPSR
ncbi:hypothetical protein RJ641_008378 [Dillenia turbinata]|uniref:Uncharacterized protein n=1 Tax=Dillenia turbinata TaxID=194707 RepID=A0AAN8V850_9MAGN